MNLSVFDHFIALVKLDSSVIGLSLEHQKNYDYLLSVDQQICILQERLETSLEKVSTLKKSVAYHDLKLKTIDSSIKAQEDLLEVTDNPQKYLKAQKDLAALRYEQLYWDDILINLWQEYEDADQEYSIFKEQVEKELHTLKEAHALVKNTLALIVQQQAEYKAMRNDMTLKFPQEWLESYTDMRNKVDNPMVIIKGQSCSGCFCIVPSQDLLALKNRKLLRCKECYRFLYIDLM